MPKQTFIELFAGIGGFRIALEQQGFKCIWANEIDSKACDVYESQWSDGTLVRGDINEVDIRNIPDHDVLVGGFPCQPFSYAGSHGGFSDTRGTLFFKIAEILKTKRPKSFIFENVKGLLSHDGGRTFSTILSTLAELGYDAEWRVLNSKDFGVPQNRERVYITGYLRSGQTLARANNPRKKQRKIAA